MHALMLGRASERAKSWLARAHGKSIPPRKLERQERGDQRRSGVHTQFWSVVFIRDSPLQIN
jgi:hypothetical protein